MRKKHAIAFNAIPDHIGPNRNELSIGRLNWPPALRKLSQAIRRGNEMQRDAMRGGGIELGDVTSDALQIGQRRICPNYLRHRGQGSSRAVPHDRSQRTTFP